MTTSTTLNSPRALTQSPSGRRPPAAGARAVVLVVEDHDDTRFLLRVLLEVRGLEVVEAADGEEAVSAAERERPALVLMDGSLPLLDGLAAARRIRESEGSRDVPVVILSARAEPDYRARALAAGCDAFLVKPFSAAQLDAVLERHGLRGRDARPAPAGQV
jgi:two-component system, cell cycle response regulator DivK